MSDSALVPFSARNSRGRGGYGTSARRATLGGGRKSPLSISGAGAGSTPSWLLQQNQELTAARDISNLSKLAMGGTQDFIDYANQRITALAGDPAMQAQYEKYLNDALVAQHANGVKNTAEGYAAQMRAGEMAGTQYLGWLNDRLNESTPGTSQFTMLSQHLADAKTWIDLQTRTMEKHAEESLAAGIASGEIPLEDGLKYMQDRRSGLAPTDPAFASITQQIAKIKDGIAARDFNGAVQTAYGKMVDAGSTIEAKQSYLGTLQHLMTTARDGAAQTALRTQITQLQTSIQKDKVLQDAQQVNAKMVDYYNPNGSTNASEVLQFLANKALNAADPAEASKYTQLAQQVQAHETAKVRAAGRGAAGPGITPTQAIAGTEEFKAAYDTALQAVNAKLAAGVTPTQADWAILKTARDNYLNVAQQAHDQGNASTRSSMDTLIKNVTTEAGPMSNPSDPTQHPWDFGSAGKKMADKIASDVAKQADDLRDVGTDETKAQAAARLNGAVQKALTSPFVQQYPESQDKLNATAEKAGDVQAKNILDASTALSTVAKSVQNIYGRYVTAMKDAGVPADKIENLTDWSQMVRTLSTAQLAARMPLNDKSNPVFSESEFMTAKNDLQKATEDSQAPAAKLATWTQQRLPNGLIDPSQQPGGNRDESARAANITGIENREGAETYAHGDFGPGTPTDAAATPGPDLASALGGGKLAAPMAPTDGSAAPDVVTPDMATRPVNDVAPDDTGMMAAPPPVDQPPPTDATLTGPQTADPWAQGGLLDETTRAAQMAGFVQSDPHAAAWSFLNAPVDFQWEGPTLPDLPPEPAFTSFAQSPDAQDRNADESTSSTFNIAPPPDFGPLEGDTTLAAGPPSSGDGGGSIPAGEDSAPTIEA